jgi:hypothetical protein
VAAFTLKARNTEADAFEIRYQLCERVRSYPKKRFAAAARIPITPRFLVLAKLVAKLILLPRSNNGRLPADDLWFRRGA